MVGMLDISPIVTRHNDIVRHVFHSETMNWFFLKNV